MVGNKGKLVIAFWLLIITVFHLGYTTPDSRVLSSDIEWQQELATKSPKAGEVFDVVYRVRLKSDNDLKHISEEAIAQGYIITFGKRPKDAVEIISDNELFVPLLPLGEWYQFTGRFKIIKPVKIISYGTEIRLKACRAGSSIGSSLYLLDSIGGIYGSKEELDKVGLSHVLWKYNNAEPQWLSEPDQSWETSNQEIVIEMRKFEPSLSDSEALCLHQDNYLLIINGIGDPGVTDSERIEYLLKNGWLEVQRSSVGDKTEWFNDFMKKNKGKWE